MGSAVTDYGPIAATDQERQAVERIERLLDASHGVRSPSLIGPNREEIELPQPVFRLLRQVVQHLANGDSVALVPYHQELTTQQAADLLNVSRPYLVKLIERGELPCRKMGRQRRVRLRDVMEHKRARDERRARDLDTLTRLSQELGLYE